MRSYPIYRSGKISGKHEFRADFIAERYCKANVIDLKPLPEILCIFRIKAKFFDIWLVNIEAPTEEKDEVKEQFYNWKGYMARLIACKFFGHFSGKVGNEKIMYIEEQPRAQSS